jgi:hypothetical protein
MRCEAVLGEHRARPPDFASPLFASCIGWRKGEATFALSDRPIWLAIGELVDRIGTG